MTTLAIFLRPAFDGSARGPYCGECADAVAEANDHIDFDAEVDEVRAGTRCRRCKLVVDGVDPD